MMISGSIHFPLCIWSWWPESIFTLRIKKGSSHPISPSAFSSGGSGLYPTLNKSTKFHPHLTSATLTCSCLFGLSKFKGRLWPPKVAGISQELNHFTCSSPIANHFQTSLSDITSRQPLLINARWRQSHPFVSKLCPVQISTEHLWHFTAHNYCAYFLPIDPREDRELNLFMFIPTPPSVMLSRSWIHTECTCIMYIT
jgi:hypothetical protein